MSVNKSTTALTALFVTVMLLLTALPAAQARPWDTRGILPRIFSLSSTAQPIVRSSRSLQSDTFTISMSAPPPIALNLPFRAFVENTRCARTPAFACSHREWQCEGAEVMRDPGVQHTALLCPTFNL